MTDPRGASRTEREEHISRLRDDAADDEAEIQAELAVERAWEDLDEWKIQTAESRYLNGLLGRS